MASESHDNRAETQGASSLAYVIEFCPECKGQILGASQWHRGDCPNKGKVFVIHQVLAVPLDAALELLRAPERRGRSYGSYALAADLLEAEFGDRA